MRYEYQELGQSAIQIIDGDRGKNYPNGSDFSPNGYCLFLNAKNVTADGFSFSERMFISEEKDKLLRKGKLQRRDTVLTTRGTVGNVAYFSDNVSYSDIRINSGMVIIRADPDIFESEFIYWLFRSSIVQNQILQLRSGTAQPQLPISSMQRLKIPVPSLDVQKTIVGIIGTLQQKIELNQKINENLERQMQTLYQNLLAENDCTLVRLENIASKIAMGPFGANIKVSTFVPSGVPIISGNHLRSFFLKEQSYNYITEEHAQKLKNSIVFPRDIIFTHAGNIGQVAMIPEGCDYPYYMISQRQFYMRCDESKIIPEIVLFFFHSIEGKGKLLANANSTGVPSIAQPSTHLKNIEMPLPAKEVQDKWYDVVRPMVRCYISLCQENKRLVKIRDVLLPKLMAGEIDVRSIKNEKIY